MKAGANESLLVAKVGQRVQLACHIFGLKLEWNRELEKWLETSSNVITGADSDAQLDKRSNYPGNENLENLDLTLGDNADHADQSLAGERLDQMDEDLVSLVFWYKDDNPTPIYTLDARQVTLSGLQLSNGQPDKSGSSADPNTTTTGRRRSNLAINRLMLAGAKHYPTQRSGRPPLSVDGSSRFPLLTLDLPAVEARDSGRYKCRVDFRRSPTISQSVRLLVEGKGTLNSSLARLAPLSLTFAFKTPASASG